MARIAHTLLEEVLELNESERAGIAAELLASLDPISEVSDSEVEQVWAEEIRRRVAHARSGDSIAIPWETVRANADRRLAAK